MENSSAVVVPQSPFAARAEQELASFHRAVAELYGPQEAARAAEDWLRAFESTRGKSEELSFRRIAQSASSRLASRLAARGTGPLGRIRKLIGTRAGHTPCFCSCGAK
jgi:hypothetical protein